MTSLAAPAISRAQFISPPVVNPANGHAYQLTGQTSWGHAQMHAVKAGGNLVTIDDAAEHAFVYSTFSTYSGRNRGLWIGLNDAAVEGDFHWISGQTPTYRNWAPGEPNNSGREDWAGIFYPGHNYAGLWNDFRTQTASGGGDPFNGVVEFDPSSPPGPILAETDATWRAIAPGGNLQGQPIKSVGTIWEPAHPGWNTDLNFDTSSWENARVINDSIWGQDADTPLYLRKTFRSTGNGRNVRLLVAVDDDAMVYVNGNLVLSDASGGSEEHGPLDVSRYVVPGQNLVAVKAHDSFGVGEGIRLMLYGSVAPGIDGDANLDGSVNGTDFALLAGNFGKTGQSWGSGDFNGDGAVNGTDFALLAGNFGRSAPAAIFDGQYLGSAAAVPEPSMLWVLAMATPLLRRRRV